MRRRVVIDITEIGKYYTITEDGLVYSHVRNRWLRPQLNRSGYVHYCLSFGVPRATWIFAHTLVAHKFLGAPPTDKHEIDHMDENKKNNHYSNLCWRTHSENILESYRRGRRGVWLGRDKEPLSLGTKILMANAKKKRIMFTLGGVETVFDSIEDAATGLGTYRKKIYLSIRNRLTFGGGYLEVVEDSI
jgi:hypothetical protein